MAAIQPFVRDNVPIAASTLQNEVWVSTSNLKISRWFEEARKHRFDTDEKAYGRLTQYRHLLGQYMMSMLNHTGGMFADAGDKLNFKCRLSLKLKYLLVTLCLSIQVSDLGRQMLYVIFETFCYWLAFIIRRYWGCLACRLMIRYDPMTLVLRETFLILRGVKYFGSIQSLIIYMKSMITIRFYNSIHPDDSRNNAWDYEIGFHFSYLIVKIRRVLIWLQCEAVDRW